MTIWIVESRTYNPLIWDISGVFSTKIEAEKAILELVTQFAEPDMPATLIMEHFRVKSIEQNVLFNVPNLTHRMRDFS